MGFKEFSSKRTNNKSFNENDKNNIEKLYDTYKDKSEDELLSELFKNVQKQKQNGTFDYNSLVSTIDKIAPFLSKEQALKIRDILEKLQ